MATTEVITNFKLIATASHARDGGIRRNASIHFKISKKLMPYMYCAININETKWNMRPQHSAPQIGPDAVNPEFLNAHWSNWVTSPMRANMLAICRPQKPRATKINRIAIDLEAHYDLPI